MSDLCDMGYLSQPHTSAGRVPTNAGYRVYIDSLKDDLLISDSTRRLINHLLDESLTDPESLPETAGEILSDLTGLPTIVSSVRSNSSYVRRVEMSPMSRHSLLMVILTSDGVARSRMCRTAMELTTDKLMMVDHILSREVIGQTLDQFNNAFLKRLIGLCGDYGVDFLPILSTVFELVKEIVDAQLRLGGREHLTASFANTAEAKQLLEFIKKNDVIYDLLERSDTPLAVVYGDGTGYKELAPVNMVIAKYYTSGSDFGYIGVIGPTRMNYESVLPHIRYFASRFGETMIQAINDLNDWEG